MGKVWIGVDIGTAGIKFVKLKGKVLEEWGFGAIPIGTVAAGIIKDYSAVSSVLKDLSEKHNFKKGRVVTSVGGRDVIIRLITVPKLEKREFKSFLSWEIERNIPLSIDETVYDYHFLRSFFDEEGEKMEVLVVAVKRSVTEGIYDIFKSAGIELEAIEANPLPMLRVDELSEEEESFMLIDIGAGMVSITVLHEGRPILFRFLPTGGNAITTAVSSSLNLSFSEAEEFKKNRSLTDIKPYIEDILSDFIGEIVRCFDYVIGQFKKNVVNRLYITGRGSCLKGLDLFLESQIGIPVKRLDSLKGIHVKKGVSEIQELRSGWGLAIGLALRGVY